MKEHGLKKSKFTHLLIDKMKFIYPIFGSIILDVRRNLISTLCVILFTLSYTNYNHNGRANIRIK